MYSAKSMGNPCMHVHLHLEEDDFTILCTINESPQVLVRPPHSICWQETSLPLVELLSSMAMTSGLTSGRWLMCSVLYCHVHCWALCAIHVCTCTSFSALFDGETSVKKHIFALHTTGSAEDWLLSSVWCSDWEDDWQRTTDHVCSTQRHSWTSDQSGSGGWSGSTWSHQTCQQAVWQIQVHTITNTYMKGYMKVHHMGSYTHTCMYVCASWIELHK